MQLSTGKVPFAIEFDDGTKETIYLNPADRGIQKRIENFEKTVRERASEVDTERYKNRVSKVGAKIDLDNVDALFEMSSEEIDEIYSAVDVVFALEKEYTDIIKQEIDSVFKSNVSAVAFSRCEPFDLVDVGGGEQEYYVIHFLKYFAHVLADYYKKSNETAQKYISKYK